MISGRVARGLLHRFHSPSISISRGKSRFSYPEGTSAYEDNYVGKAEYPEPNYETRNFTVSRLSKLNETLAWHKSIRTKDTIEEKLIEMNIMRRYGWNSYILTEDQFDYDGLAFYQHITKTHLFPESELPQVYNDVKLNEKVEYYAQKLQHIFQDIIKLELYGLEYIPEENETPAETSLKKAQSMVNQVSRLLIQALSTEEQGLLDTQVDYMPKLEAFWFAGGFEPDTNLRENRKRNLKRLEEKYPDNDHIAPDALTEQTLQYIGTPIVQVRTKYLNPTFVERDVETDYIRERAFTSSPNSFGHFPKVRFACNTPGHWPNDPYKNNLLSFHSSHFLNFNRAYDIPDELNLFKHPSWLKRVPDLLKSQGILTSFGHLVAQAYILGFDQFSDISYPMTTQTVITNGQDWSFYTYQLNTMQLGAMHHEKNNKVNCCWSTPSMKILDETGSANMEVLKSLLKFYLIQTVSQEQRIPETPNVNFDLDTLPDNYAREYILYNLHEMYSQKGETLSKWQMPEIYNWEKIYKVQHKTRPFEPKRRFFEIPGQSAYNLVYRFRDPRYKPKRLRYLLGELANKKEQQAIDQLKEQRKARFIEEDEESSKHNHK